MNKLKRFFTASRTREPKQITATDKREMRRRRARRRTVVRIAVVALVVIAAVLVWHNWEYLSPDNWAYYFEEWFGGGTGSYPVNMAGTHVHRLAQAEDYAAVLTDSHLIYLNRNGAEVSRYNCAYPTSVLRTAGEYVLVAEQGGTRLHLSTRNKVVLEKTIEKENKILSASVNAEGQIAVLTNGPQGYLIQITVYDRDGKLLYTRNRNHTATDITLSPDGTQVTTLSVDANNGNLRTSMDVFSLQTNAPEALCSYVTQDSLLYRAEYLNGGWVAGFSEQGVVMMNTATGATTAYTPADKHVLGFAVAGNDCAVAVRPYGDTGGGQIHIVNTNGTVSRVLDFTGGFRHLSGYEQQYVVLTDSYVQYLSATAVGTPVAVKADGQQVVLTDGRGVVLGLNRLEAFDLIAE